MTSKASTGGYRHLLEILTVIILVCMGLSILGLGGQKEAELTYDGGQITYVGQVRNNRMNGQGRLVYDNGDQYEGEFVNGVFQGQGKFTSHTGWTYEGEFAQGQPHGKGKLIAKDQTVYEGKFKQGIYQK